MSPNPWISNSFRHQSQLATDAGAVSVIHQMKAAYFFMDIDEYPWTDVETVGGGEWPGAENGNLSIGKAGCALPPVPAAIAADASCFGSREQLSQRPAELVADTAENRGNEMSTKRAGSDVGNHGPVGRVC